jgi:hypothetical protein
MSVRRVRRGGRESPFVIVDVRRIEAGQERLHLRHAQEEVQVSRRDALARDVYQDVIVFRRDYAELYARASGREKEGVDDVAELVFLKSRGRLNRRQITLQPLRRPLVPSVFSRHLFKDREHAFVQAERADDHVRPLVIRLAIDADLVKRAVAHELDSGHARFDHVRPKLARPVKHEPIKLRPLDGVGRVSFADFGSGRAVACEQHVLVRAVQAVAENLSLDERVGELNL